MALAWAISGATLGAYADKKESKKGLLVLSVIAFSLLSAASGMVTTFVSLLVFRAMMGIAEGPVLPISQSLIAEASTPSRRGLNMGLVNASAPGLIGAVLAPPVLIWMATHYGWRTAFYLSCIPGLIIAFLIWKFVQHKRGAHPSAGVDPETKRPSEYMALLKNRNILLCVLISCFYISWFITLISFTPTFLMTVKKFSPETMGSIMSSLGFAWMIWGFVVSALSDKIGRKPAMIIFSILASFCPMVLLYVNSASAMLPLVFLTYTGLGCFTLFMATIPAETVHPSQIASALGLIMGVGELFGGFVTPTIAGFAADQYGLSIVMWIASAGSVIATILTFFLKETAPSKVATQFQERHAI